MDDDLDDTQWTATARESYVRRADELIDSLRAHVVATIERFGGQAERDAHMQSAKGVRAAAVAFDDAEFDWCGTFPLGLPADDQDDDEDEWDAEEDSSGPFLTLTGQWDFSITDLDAAIAAGRAAYLRAWPDESDDDARARVQEVGDAAAEVFHTDGLNGLLATDGMALLSYSATFDLHDGTEPAEDEPVD